MKLHTGDSVIVISGKDKGKNGTVIRVLDSENRVVVEGVNMRTRHIPKTVQQAGRKIHYEASIDASKVMLVDPKTGKPSRIGYVMKGDKKMRISKLSGEEVKKGKMPAKVKKEEKEAKETKKTAAKEETQGAPAKGGKFWQKMKFGAAAMDQADTQEPNRTHQDHSVPQQQSHVRSGGRGS